MNTEEPPEWHTLNVNLDQAIDVRIAPVGRLELAINTPQGRGYQVTSFHPGIVVALRDWLVEHAGEYEQYAKE
jgi:hypothetical protein